MATFKRLPNESWSDYTLNLRESISDATKHYRHAQKITDSALADLRKLQALLEDVSQGDPMQRALSGWDD